MKAVGISLILIAFSLSCFAQQLSNDLFFPDEQRFVQEVKQLDQFFKRFNNEERILSGLDKAKDQLLDESEIEVTIQSERKKVIRSLLNFEDSTLLHDSVTVEFINNAGNDSSNIRLDYYDDDWYAQVNCAIKFKGKKQNIFLTLTKEGNTNKGFKWVIIGVSAPFINLLAQQKDSTKFISPKNHELGFIDLSKAFIDSDNITKYSSKFFLPDDLSVFFYLVKAKEIQFIQVNHIQYHFLQIPNWVFTVDYYNRADFNSGWLISSLSQISDSEKQKYKKNNLYLKQ